MHGAQMVVDFLRQFPHMHGVEIGPDSLRQNTKMKHPLSPQCISTSYPSYPSNQASMPHSTLQCEATCGGKDKLQCTRNATVGKLCTQHFSVLQKKKVVADAAKVFSMKVAGKLASVAAEEQQEKAWKSYTEEQIQEWIAKLEEHEAEQLKQLEDKKVEAAAKKLEAAARSMKKLEALSDEDKKKAASIAAAKPVAPKKK